MTPDVTTITRSQALDAGLKPEFDESIFRIDGRRDSKEAIDLVGRHVAAQRTSRLPRRPSPLFGPVVVTMNTGAPSFKTYTYVFAVVLEDRLS